MYTYIRAKNMQGKTYVLGPYRDAFAPEYLENVESLESQGIHYESFEHKSRNLNRVTREMKEGRVSETDFNAAVENIRHVV